MHVQVVTFNLQGVSGEEYHEGCKGETGVFADLPGLLAKIWLRDPDENVYGAVYLWADREHYEAYVNGEIFKAILEDDSLSGVVSRNFGVYEDLTAQTSPGLSLGGDSQ